MEPVRMKGRTVDEAVSSALAVLGLSREAADVKVINEGKPAVMGIIGGEEAEVEVAPKGASAERAREALQGILDLMEFLAAAEVAGEAEGGVSLVIKGEDLGRIIGKEGAMLKALETIVGAMIWKAAGVRTRVAIDAAGYRDKRVKALERLAAEVIEEVTLSGQEKAMPPMEASDRRIIHMYLKDNPQVTSYSRGEGKDRRLVIAPRG